jgi:hypothetical protein
MGRQFTYYCLPNDLAGIQHQVFAPADGRLVSTEKVGGTHVVVPVESFALEGNRMGHETVFLLLLPPPPMQREVRNGPWIDTSKSHVVEVGRCFTDGKLVRSARFWYETRFFEGAKLRMKPPEFVAWAERIFRKTKGLLQRHEVNYRGHAYAEWFGPQAWSEVSNGNLLPSPN